jgi:antitoxin component of RelBE/YafQ-DinJ toxin-antitoxin module
MSKNNIINVKTEQEVKVNFSKACEDNFTTPSNELYKFIRQYIKRNQSKAIPLNQLRK